MGRLKPCYGLGEGEGDIDACTLVFLLSIGRYEIRLEGGPNKETLVVVVGMTSVCSESRPRPRADFIVFTVFLLVSGQKKRKNIGKNQHYNQKARAFLFFFPGQKKERGKGVATIERYCTWVLFSAHTATGSCAVVGAVTVLSSIGRLGLLRFPTDSST